MKRILFENFDVLVEDKINLMCVIRESQREKKMT
jgi:hypothetical protein